MDAKARYVPSLEECARPFLSAEFELLEKKNFCCATHSAGPRLTAIMTALTPVLGGRSAGPRDAAPRHRS